jgi:SPP1 gp7 family putative phage head morphogenesis protein
VAGFVDLEKIAIRSDRALSRLDAGQTREIEGYLSTALRRTLDQTQPLYARAMRDVDGTASNAAFRLARGRVLADEIEGTVRGFVGQPDGALEGLLARTAQAREQARGFVEETLGVFGDAVTISTPVNHRALSGVVENAATRLYLHADEAVDRIKSDVVTGLVRGDSWTQVTKAIREDTGYLRYRAERIALTELHSAQADARQELYEELGVELVIRYVTIDDRTCEYCAPRQGEVTKRSETTEVLHPFCRCILAPFDPEWALDDTLVPEQLEEMLTDNLEQLEELGIEPNLGTAPFERQRDRAGFRVGPAGRGRPAAVWRPGLPTDRLLPFVGRSFTNLAPHVRPPAGVATPPAAGAPTDPVEQARVLPKKARDQLAQVDAEAGSLKAAADAAQTAATDAKAAWRAAPAGTPQRTIAFNHYMDANRANLEAQRALGDFRRARGHEILANTTTGHANGRVAVAARMRDADLKVRTEKASTWLAEHTTLKIDHATNVRRLRPGTRAYHRSGEVFVAPTDGVKVLVHELGHAVDHAHPSYVQRAIAYRETRTVGETWQRLRDITGNTSYRLDEVAKCDRFIDCYMGKNYGTRSTEILSMGLEYMYDDPVGFAQKDPTTFDFIFRLMKGLPDA